MARKFYRDKFNGKLFGVCAGFGDYFGTDPLWFRLGFVIVVFLGFGLIIPVYFVIAVITPKKPPSLYSERLEQIFGESRAQDIAAPVEPATRKENER
jgi:phage shock protein C